MGQDAVFTVGASGAAPLTYQWRMNDVDISGATSSNSVTISSVQQGENGAVLTVVVSNRFGKVTSSPATLNVGARSPLAGDLRFQQVDATSTLNGYAGDQSTILLGRAGLSYANHFGTPLPVGSLICGEGMTPYSCNWPITAFSLPADSGGGLTMAYQSDYLASFDKDMADILTDPSTVVTSLAISSDRNSFAASYVSATQTVGFDAMQHSVASGDFQDAASEEGQKGRVITAVTFNAGQVEYYSYGWDKDASSIYEAQVSQATTQTLVSVASQLSSNGYIVTSIGGNPADGFLIVGTRVKGDSTPRAFVAADGGTQRDQVWNQGYATVGLLEDDKGNLTWLGQK